jgi:hypothetical protein
MRSTFAIGVSGIAIFEMGVVEYEVHRTHHLMLSRWVLGVLAAWDVLVAPQAMALANSPLYLLRQDTLRA